MTVLFIDLLCESGIGNGIMVRGAFNTHRKVSELRHNWREVKRWKMPIHQFLN